MGVGTHAQTHTHTHTHTHIPFVLDTEFSSTICNCIKVQNICSFNIVSVKDYNLLKETLGNVIEEIDDISESGQIVVDGRQYKVEFFLGGDYKVCELKT